MHPTLQKPGMSPVFARHAGQNGLLQSGVLGLAVRSRVVDEGGAIHRCRSEAPRRSLQRPPSPGGCRPVRRATTGGDVGGAAQGRLQPPRHRSKHRPGLPHPPASGRHHESSVASRPRPRSPGLGEGVAHVGRAVLRAAVGVRTVRVARNHPAGRATRAMSGAAPLVGRPPTVGDRTRDGRDRADPNRSRLCSLPPSGTGSRHRRRSGTPRPDNEKSATPTCLSDAWPRIARCEAGRRPR